MTTPSESPSPESVDEPAAPAASSAATPVPPSVFDLPLRPPRVGDIPRWLWRGLEDFTHAPEQSLFYGGCFVAMAWTLIAMFHYAPVYVLVVAAGFLILGPFLCMGLYRISQQLDAGRRVSLRDSLLTWRRCTSALGVFGFALLIIEMLWARVTLVIFALCFDGMPDFKGSIHKLVEPGNVEFIVSWLAAGAFFGGLIFAICVISIPMIMDREVDAISAALTSLRLVLTQTGVMFLWALTIFLLVVVAMVPGFLGLFLVGPMIGHATWHAYRTVMPAPTGPGEGAAA